MGILCLLRPCFSLEEALLSASEHINREINQYVRSASHEIIKSKGTNKIMGVSETFELPDNSFFNFARSSSTDEVSSIWNCKPQEKKKKFNVKMVFISRFSTQIKPLEHTTVYKVVNPNQCKTSEPNLQEKDRNTKTKRSTINLSLEFIRSNLSKCICFRLHSHHCQALDRF